MDFVISCSYHESVMSEKVKIGDVLNDAINHPDWIILDIREEDELVRDGNLRDQGNARNWVHIPSGQVAQALALSSTEFESAYHASYLTKSVNIVVHCRSGRRSIPITDLMVKMGYKAVDYPGGIIKWKEHFFDG